MQKILIVEDDKALSNGIALALKAESYIFLQAYDGKEARALLDSQDICLAILDLGLSDRSGLQLLEKMKQETHIPVVILAEPDADTEHAVQKIQADDSITKPFSLTALRTRINTHIRKARSGGLQVYQSGPYYFAFQSREFVKGERHVELNQAEQKLLKLLVENRGLTLSRSELAEKIWAEEAGNIDENALSVTVKRLRDKLEDNPSSPRYIKTVYGIGYTWMDERIQLMRDGTHG